jgi:muramoyltetrapeptide carboxypeptidase
MKRKEFISGAALFAGSALVPGKSFGSTENTEPELIRPAYLKTGDTIAITCPAGYISLEDIQPAVKQMEGWGFKIRIGNTVGKRDFTFGGTDEERAKDLQILLDDPTVKAIMCARGGYGVSRIIDKISFTRLRERPKWIIGFSDITALHLHINRNFPMVSLHSKMCNSFPDNWDTAEPVVQETILSIRNALTGTKMKYLVTPDELNRTGIGEGALIGGNLSIIQNLMATSSEIATNGKILFLEEVGEYLYSLDRMFMNLKRAGKLSGLKGLIIGGFNKIKTDDPGEEFGKTVYDIVMEKVENYKYPVCFNFPVGHQKNNYALKCGAIHVLTVRKDTVELVEK